MRIRLPVDRNDDQIPHCSSTTHQAFFSIILWKRKFCMKCFCFFINKEIKRNISCDLVAMCSVIRKQKQILINIVKQYAQSGTYFF